jgi:8-oxo-dGTP pyrophosphatase MutT (NUDIX family)
VKQAPDLALAHLKARLAAHRPAAISVLTAPTRAAVAAVLRYHSSGPDTLLIKRATHAKDRWSGHCSFPGGHRDRGDPNLVATAIREAREEVGLELDDGAARLLGRLDDVRAIGKGKPLPMAITPFVFLVEGDPRLVLGAEAESAFWLPLDQVASGALDDTFRVERAGVGWPFPCWSYQGYSVWGLTYRMISSLFELLR